MKLIEFETYEAYVEAQRRTVARRGKGPFFTDVEFQRLADWLRARGVEGPIRGICHGARNGQEADELAKNFPGSDVIGTDLFPHSGKSAAVKTESEVVKWDFSKQKREWIGRFDVVYSNSLDHARDPVQTLGVWLKQLKKDGRLFIQWNRNANKTKGGDCFGADLAEYIEIMNGAGTMLDLIYCKCGFQRKNPLRRRACEIVLLVVVPPE